MLLDQLQQVGSDSSFFNVVVCLPIDFHRLDDVLCDVLVVLQALHREHVLLSLLTVAQEESPRPPLSQPGDDPALIDLPKINILQLKVIQLFNQMILRRLKLIIIDAQVRIVFLDGEALLVVKIVTSAIWL